MQRTKEIIACIASSEKSQDVPQINHEELQKTLQTVHKIMLECHKIVQGILERIEESEKEEEHGHNCPQ